VYNTDKGLAPENYIFFSVFILAFGSGDGHDVAYRYMDMYRYFDAGVSPISGVLKVFSCCTTICKLTHLMYHQ
jgi:hypothetical protein